MRIRLLGLPAAVLVAILPLLLAGALIGPALAKGQKIQPERYSAQSARRLPQGAKRARPQTSAAAPAATTFSANMSENFEGAWPAAGWSVQDYGNSGGQYVLGKRNCNPSQGGFAGWTVGGGADGGSLPCSGSYPDNVYSVAVYGPFDLGDAVSSVLTFDFTGASEADYDQLFIGASIDDSYYCGNLYSGDSWSSSYNQGTVDLSDMSCSGVPSSLLGLSNVTLAVMFISDESNTDIGFTVDNLNLVSETAAPTSTPTTRPTNTPTTRPTNTPTEVPTDTPIGTPTNTPVGQPTNTPTEVPTNTPTEAPTNTPTEAPTNTPTETPTPPATNLNLIIRNIETTQAVQTGQSTVPLIAGRPAVVRVSVGVQNSATGVVNVTARLHGVRNGTELPNSPLTPFNARGNILAPLSPNRGNFDDTLNFQLPADWTTGGPLTVWAEVNPAHTIDEANYGDNRSADLGLTFRTMPTLKIMLVPIAYQPNGRGTIMRPDLTQNNQGLSNLQNLYPIADVQATLHAEYLFTGDLNGDDTGWEKLLDQITAVRNRELGNAARTSKVVYYGVVPQAAVAGQSSFTAGIGWVGGNILTSVGLEDSNGVAAHEIGHNLGLNHAPCGVSGDPAYPFADGRIGDVGVDVYERQLHSDTDKDFMSYCRPIWVSAFHYLKMLQVLSQGSAPPPLRGAIPAQVGDGLLIAGSIYSDTVTGQLTSSVPVTGVSADSGDANGAYRIDLRDTSGAVKFSYNFSPSALDSHTTAPSFGFSFTAPQIANLSAIELYKGNRLISTQQASAVQPNLTATATSTADAITVTWQASSPDGAPVHVGLRYSPDNGLSWRVLALDVPGNSFVLSKRNLPSSTGGLLEVIANNATQARTVQLNTGSIGNKAPVLSIAGNSTVQAYVGQPVVVQATALDLEDGYLQGSSLVWTDQRGQTVGVGESLVLPNGLALGSHTLTVSATDSNGARTQDSVTINVVKAPPVRVSLTYSVYIPIARRP